MGLSKYYSLDECNDREELFNYLNTLKDKSKINYKLLEYDDLISVVDLTMSDNDIKKMQKIFDKLDIIVFTDWEEIHDVDWDETSEYQEDDFYGDDEY